VSDAVDVGSKRGQVECSNDKIPALGLSWANAVTTRLMLSRTEQYVTIALHDSNVAASMQHCDSSASHGTYEANVRNLRVLFAPHLPNATCRFIVDGDGVKGLPGDS